MYFGVMTTKKIPDNPDMAQLPCFNLTLRKATRVMNRVYDQYLSPLELKVGQFSILRAAYILGETSNKQLQSILVLDQTTLTRNLKPLIRDGYLLTQPGADRRQKVLCLSGAGREKYRQAELVWVEAQQEIYQKLGHELSQQLLDLSDTIVQLD